MRKDVRMGFAVGGVLLTVLVVAILVFHRNRNAEKAVGFDSGGKAAVSSGADLTATDGASSQDGAASSGASPAQPPAPAPGPVVSNTPSDNNPQNVESPEKGGAKWDVLFASTAADPIRASLTSESPEKPKTKSKKHKPDALASDLNDRHDSSAAPAVANAPVETAAAILPNSQPLRSGASERLAAGSAKESGRTHTVASGETFVSIARAVYGDGRYYQALIDANPSVDPDKLKPGTTIQIPSDSQVKHSPGKSSRSAASSSKSTDGKTYTVQSGDSLYKIAKKLYGNGEKSADLYEANKQTIGPDSTRLKIGMILTLTEAPSVR